MASNARQKAYDNQKGVEVSLPGGGTKNLKTGKVTYPPMKMPPPVSPQKADKMARDLIAEIKKKGK